MVDRDLIGCYIFDADRSSAQSCSAHRAAFRRIECGKGNVTRAQPTKIGVYHLGLRETPIGSLQSMLMHPAVL